jgi:hypothetical protein
MIPINDPILFAEALDCLALHKRNVGRDFKGRFIQIFLGMKFFQNSLPSMFSGSFVTTEVLQTLLDDLYSKISRPANDCVLSIFENNYLPRTGLIPPGRLSGANNWRNNFNLQKGIGCFAPPADLSSMTFLNEDRINCRYLNPTIPGVLGHASCTLCLTGASYRNESHRKWLKIDPTGNNYAIVDLQNIPNFLPYMAHDGKRIPILPLLIALYHEADPGVVLGTRTNVQLSEFMSDFNLSQAEYLAYFDDSMYNPANAKLVASSNWSSGFILGSFMPPSPAAPTPVPTTGPSGRAAPLTPVLTGTLTPPPGINTGWEAEQFVAAALLSDGWDAHVVARQQLGYDIFATKGLKKRYIEVKSSLGLCSPSMTAREWQQSKYHANCFVLAVVENFNPTGQNMIYWVPDPSNCCSSTPQTTISYSISRSTWTLSAVPLNNI